MKFKNFKIIALILLSLTNVSLYGHDMPEMIEENSVRCSAQQQMIAHFFNIVIQGLLLASAEKKEDQIQAAANAVNSLSTITQLTVRSPLFKQALVEYAIEHREEILADIAYNLNLIDQIELHSEHVQID